MAESPIITPPENTNYDRRRHEEMRLRPLGMYGIPKFIFDSRKMNCCERCVFGSGEHLETCPKSE